MARLFPLEREFESPDGLSRGDPSWLVEIDPAIDLEPGRWLLPRLARAAALARFGAGLSVFSGVAGHCLSSSPTSFRSRATSGDLNSASIRAWSSKLMSRAKRKSGANLRLTR